MKKPYFPASDDKVAFETFEEFLKEMLSNQKSSGFLRTLHEKYPNWEELSNHELPKHLKSDHKTLWSHMKIFRLAQGQLIHELYSKDTRPFSFCKTNTIDKALHIIDNKLADNILLKHTSLDEGQKDEWMRKHMIASLINEAITSSQIEGAATSRKQAQDLIKSEKRPRNDSERMIINNYAAIREITSRYKNENLSPELIKELHSLLTKNLLEDSGSFRKRNDIVVIDSNEILFVPPEPNEIQKRIEDLCLFINNSDAMDFIHPVLKAIILHFAIGYIHPFSDGNGRTARALFYWYMIKEGYKLFEYVSISDHIKKTIGQYKKAYLNTELDGGDLTYFIYYHLKIINSCIEDIDKYLNKKISDYHKLKKRIRSNEKLNLRQIDLLNHSLKNKDTIYTIKSHMTSNGISWGTARKDLLELAEMQLLEKKLAGKELVFLSVDNLYERL